MGFPIRTAEANITVLDLDGDLDRHTGVRKLQTALTQIKPDKQTRLVMNFDGVTYICSEAVGMICAVAEEIRKAGGKAACCSVTGLPKDVFEILGVSKILPMADNEAEAARTLG